MPRPTYLDFDLRIEEQEPYWVATVINSPAGQVETRCEALSQERRQIIRLTIENVILRSQVASLRHFLLPKPNRIREIGRDLFEAIFTEEVRNCYEASLAYARSEGKGLRLRLRLAPEVSGLPWELLYDPRGRVFLAMSVDTPVVRYLELRERIQPLTVEEVLRVLVLISSPLDYALIEAAEEKDRIRHALDRLLKRGVLRVDFLEGPRTLDRLRHWLRNNDFHVLHFIGHGIYDDRRREGYLIGEDEKGRGIHFSAEQVCTTLRGTSTCLVVLNACQGAIMTRHDPFASVGAALVNAAIPAVVAMQFEITDFAAREFAEEFYEAIADGWPVDAALAHARQAVDQAIPDSLEWATPVLFMRSPDGILFDLTQVHAREEERRPVSSSYVEIGDQLVQLAEQVALSEEDTIPPEKYLSQARDMYQQAIQSGGESAEVYFNLAMVLNELRQVEDALQAFSNATTLDPSYSDAYRERGVVHYGLGHYQEAIHDLEKAIELRPDDDRARWWREQATERKTEEEQEDADTSS